MENILENERIDDLEYKGLKIIQNKDGFCFGIDSILLSDFASEIKRNSKVIDLGTGTGIIGIMLCAKTELSQMVGVEIQKEVYDMAKRSIKLNKLQHKKLLSRHEITANLEDFIKVSAKLLKDKGNLYMVHRPDRLVDIIEHLRKYKLEPKKIRFIEPSIGKEANLILIKATKNAKPFLKIEKTLYVYKENGEYTNEILKIYNKEK